MNEGGSVLKKVLHTMFVQGEKLVSTVKKQMLWNSPIAIVNESATHLTISSILYFMKPTVDTGDEDFSM